jgi:predicted Zn-dependent protease
LLMRRCFLLLLLSVLGVCGSIGCASWRQPVPTVPSEPVAVNLSTSPKPAVIVVPLASSKVEVASAQPTIVTASATVEQKAAEPAAEPLSDVLTLVAESLDRGDKIAAVNHLEAYVHQHPDQVMFRLQLAELLVQVNRDARAKTHYERFLACAQTASGPVHDYLVHTHTRLMEIAQRGDDSFGEVLHRGIGLLLLIQEQDKKPDRDDGFCEEMLCKALRALNEARDLKPEDPRVRVYLAEVYERMGNRRASANERSAGRNNFVPGALTPAERSLILVPGP